MPLHNNLISLTILHKSIYYKVRNYCYGFDLNIDMSLLIAADGFNIMIIGFVSINRCLKLISKVQGHERPVTQLYFMKQDNFLSASMDHNILIWGKQKRSEWHILKTLNGHYGFITCIVISKDQNMIFSGSEDFKIKVWEQELDWKCSQTISEHQHYVMSLSLNQSNTKLISIEFDSLIIIFELSIENLWMPKQKIVVNNGHYVYFISRESFVFIPYKGNLIGFYAFNKKKMQFMKIQDHTIQAYTQNKPYFPPELIKSKQILLIKAGKVIYIINLSLNQDVQIFHQIEFQTQILCGKMSRDGNILITWDQRSNQIQISKMCYKL